MEAPKSLYRFLKKLEEQGENAAIISPAILERYSTDKMRAIVRMGLTDERKIFGYIVATNKSVHYVRPGLLWDNAQTISLDHVTNVKYFNEFLTNTLELEIGKMNEKIIFYDETDGINFYHFIKFQQWKE
jgi:hypothetical protein